MGRTRNAGTPASANIARPPLVFVSVDVPRFRARGFTPRRGMTLDRRRLRHKQQSGATRGRKQADLARSLVLCLKRVIAAWRYDLSGQIGSLDAPRHLDKSPSQAGGGLENPVCSNLAAQCGGESRDVGKANLAPRYFQRIKRPQRRLGTVATDDFR